MLFDGTDTVANSTTINNVVGTSISITSLSYTQTGASAWHNTEITSGQTLTITGSAPLTVGSGTSTVTNVTLSGAGSLSMSNAGGTIQVGSGNGNAALLDMSGLASFSASLGSTGQLNVGHRNGSNSGSSTMRLAMNSTVTVGSINLGEYGTISAGPGTQTLSLGSATNVFNVNTINVGANGDGASGSNTSRSSGTLDFYGSTGSVTIRGFAGGTTRAEMNLVDGASSTSADIVSIVNFFGHSADVRLGNLDMARRTGTGAGATNPGSGTATFSFDTGNLDVTSIFMAGREQVTVNKNATATLNLGSSGSTGTSTIGSMTMANNTQATGTALATINVAGGTHTVVGNITMSASSTVGGIATSAINLTGGTFTVQGNITEGAGAGTKNSTITLNGGTFDMDGGSIAVDTFQVQSGTLRNLGEFNSGSNLTKTTGGTVTLNGTNTYHGSTVVSAGTVVLADNASMTFYIGANAVNNSINGTGTLNLDGDFIFDLSGASAVDGNAWQIVNVGTLTETFGSTFSIIGFTESSNVWTFGNYRFSEATGILNYTAAIPEPQTVLLFTAGIGWVLFRRQTRKK